MDTIASNFLGIPEKNLNFEYTKTRTSHVYQNVKPTIETIKNVSYPIYTNGYITIRKDEKEDSNARKWVNAVLSKRGSKIIEENQLA